MSALSDSTTSTDSPRSTRSPGFLSHSTTFPSVMVEERAGIKMSWVANGELPRVWARFYAGTPRAPAQRLPSIDSITPSRTTMATCSFSTRLSPTATLHGPSS